MTSKMRYSLAALGLAIGQLTTPGHAEMNIDYLKGAYLECERGAVRGGLVADEIMRCSLIYEQLKQSAFGGEFGKLKAWADERKAAEGSS